MRLTILHTNDIHGHQERLAQIATLVQREKASSLHTVLYLDGGDVEETTNPLSNVTKGTAMHRLLGCASCDAATVGNACWLRYGAGVLADHARAAPYPLLLANLAPVAGPVPSALFGDVGVFGLTDPFREIFEDVDWGFEPLDELEVARATSADLRRRGARLVVLLSHLGLEKPEGRWDDRRIAEELQDDVDLIVGAHSHDLLPEGEWVGRVLITQAGAFGEHLGRIEIDDGSISASVAPVDGDVQRSLLVEEEAARIVAEVEELLADELGSVDAELDAGWIAGALRRRMGTEVGLFSEGLTAGVLPPGRVTRRALYEVSETGANPAATTMTGAQLAEVIERGNDPAFIEETPRSHRGRRRGHLHMRGVTREELVADRAYTVAGTDWELAPYGGYVLADWNLEVRFDFPTIVREAIEEELTGQRVDVELDACGDG
ncbi:MAG TPA: 5'-nucleotidase C-terminal domain-containing protein [Gaiellaceae bacterium]|nr:5'-nucleotidase C-terminal domain-containing protein [Gaiellaceae bacterium]